MKFVFEAIGGVLFWVGVFVFWYAYSQVKEVPDLWSLPAYDLGYQLGKLAPGIVLGFLGVILVVEGRRRA